MFGSVGVKLVSVAAVQEGVHFLVVQVDLSSKNQQSHSWKKQRDHQNPALKQNKPEMKVKAE